MKRVGRGHVDSIHLGIFDQLAVPFVALRHVELPAERLDRRGGTGPGEQLHLQRQREEQRPRLAPFPEALAAAVQQRADLLFVGVGMIAVIGAIVYVERAQRKIPVQYPSRMVGRGRMTKSIKTSLPLKANTAGVIPPIFASSLLMFPSTITSWFKQSESSYADVLGELLNPIQWQYNTLYGILILFFAFFYTAVTFNPVDVADNMKKSGGYIPGIRPGKRTADYIDSVLTRITFGGAVYVSAVCVLPTILVQQFNVPFYFGGTALLIVVGVAIDTMTQIESHMLTRHYEGFMKKGLVRTGR